MDEAFLLRATDRIICRIEIGDQYTIKANGRIDIVSRKAADLGRLYPQLGHNGTTTFSSLDVMRYLGKRIPLSGDVPKRFLGEGASKLKHRQDGVSSEAA